MATTAEAKGYYEWLLRTRDLSHGLKLTRDTSQLHLIQDWNWVYDGITYEAVDDKSVPVFASPWHACVFLYQQMALWANDDLAREPRASIAVELEIPSSKLPPIALLFRGQGNPIWKIESSLHRKSASARGEALSAAGIFAALLHRTFLECGFPFVDPLSLMAAAQHYEIATDLLDFSLDPAVAVYFANEESDDHDTGVVFGISWAKAWKRFGFKVILPPPLIERLYIQRGVFLEFDYNQSAEFRSECIEVRFRKHADFVVLREDRPEPSIKKVDAYLDVLSRTGRDWAAAGNRWQSAELSRRREWTERHFREVRPHLNEEFEHGLIRDAIGLWMKHSVDLLEGLSVGRTKNGVQLVANVIESLVLNNPILSTLIASYYYGQFDAYHFSRDKFEAQEAFTYQLAREISSVLKSVAANDFIPEFVVDE